MTKANVEVKRSMRADYVRYYKGLVTDEAKIACLLMLKERGQLQQDKGARDALFDLAPLWMQEEFR